MGSNWSIRAQAPSRRDWLRGSAASAAWLAAGGTLSPSGWLPHLAAAAAGDPQRKRSCIVLWMAGGPSQTDTFDLKIGHANGGPTKGISTRAPGLVVSEHLPAVAAQMQHLAVVRSMSTREGDHGRATLHLRTGAAPQGAIEFPVLGSLVSKERQDDLSDLPSYVSIHGRAVGEAALSAGFLGPRHAPLIVGGGDEAAGNLQVADLRPAAAMDAERSERRLELLRRMQTDFAASRPGVGTESHASAYDRAVRLMRESAARAFNLDEEPAALRDRYGRNRFGQGCLLARRLVERGVPFVEVAQNGWDTHVDDFNETKSLCGVLDPAWGALMADLADRGMLETTTIVWMGEFGRTPAINPRLGRDHYPQAWSVVLGGGGIQGGATLGRTSADGGTVEERPVAVEDLLATICLAVGVDPKKQNMSNVGRPIRIVDPAAKPLHEILS